MAKASRVGLALSEETLTETALYEMALAHELDGKVAISLATKPQEAKHGGDWEYPVGAIADFAERTDRCRLYRWAGFWDATSRLLALEKGLGCVLVERHATGYRLTERRQILLATSPRWKVLSMRCSGGWPRSTTKTSARSG
jgi:hypothetical protein